MNRYQFLESLITSFRRIDGRTSPWDDTYTFNHDIHGNAISQDLFVDEINSFPCVMVTVLEQLVSHTGGGQRWSTIRFRVRAVTWDEDSALAGEQLADDLEHVIKHLRDAFPALQEVRLDRIQTDEGINQPLAAVIVEGTSLYRHE